MAPRPAQPAKTEILVSLAPNPAKNGKIEGLKLVTERPGNLMEAKIVQSADGSQQWGVRVRAFHKTDHSLSSFSKDVRIEKTSEKPLAFEIFVPLHGDQTPLDFFSVSPLGKVEKTSYILKCERWAELKVRLPKQAPQKSFGFYGTLGFTTISYHEEGVVDFSEKTLTAKWGMNWTFLPPRWDIGIGGYVTLVPLSKQPSDHSATFIGANVRLGYVFPPFGKWRFALYGGTYYATMLPSPEVFGFQNLMGPQLYPLITRTFDHSSLSVYLKFSPMGESVAIRKLSDHELAFGFSWGRPLNPQNILLVQGDYSSFTFSQPDFQFNVNTISLSVGIRH